MVELMIAMAVFLVVCGAAISLVNKHTPLFNQQQNQAGLNVSLRNAVAQMQIDVVNAGSGFSIPGITPKMIPIGVMIKNTAGGACYDAATFSYTAGCFDELHIISAAPGVPVGSPISATSCVSTSSSTLNVVPAATLGSTPTQAQLDALSNPFQNGDQILVLATDGTNVTQTALVGLTDGGDDKNGKWVNLQHNPQGTVEANSLLQVGTRAGNPNNQLNGKYCAPNSFVFKLGPEIVYGVDTTDPTNPVLYKQVGGGAKVAIAEQIIGFKVGAMAWNSPTDIYSFNAPAAPPTGYNQDWGVIRSVMISLIGRTQPEPGNNFRNQFDGGPYRIQPMTVVINPRNLSMHD